VDENGKPTKWKAADYQPRTHWVDVEKNKVFLDTTVTTAGNFAPVQLAGRLELGQTYIVTFAGQQYSCVCKDGFLQGMYASYLGNSAVFGGEYGNEPFALIQFNWLGHSSLIAFPDGEYSIKVEGDAKVHHAISSKLLPKTIWLIDIDYDNPSINVTALEMERAINNGELIALREIHYGSELFTIYYFVGRHADGLRFASHYGDYYNLADNENGGYNITKAN
jgi:hypothetical protein